MTGASATFGGALTIDTSGNVVTSAAIAVNNTASNAISTTGSVIASGNITGAILAMKNQSSAPSGLNSGYGDLYTDGSHLYFAASGGSWQRII